MNTLFISIALFVNFVHPINNGQQRAEAQPIVVVEIVTADEEIEISNTITCTPAELAPVAAPVESIYYDGLRDDETAYSDWLSDLGWWYEQFNICQ